MTHTKTPWVVSGDEIEDENGKYVCHVGGGDMKDGEFIVCAVNSHEALVDALKDMLYWFGDEAHNIFMNEAVEKAEMAIKMAKGE